MKRTNVQSLHQQKKLTITENSFDDYVKMFNGIIKILSSYSETSLNGHFPIADARFLGKRLQTFYNSNPLNSGQNASSHFSVTDSKYSCSVIRGLAVIVFFDHTSTLLLPSLILLRYAYIIHLIICIFYLLSY